MAESSAVHVDTSEKIDPYVTELLKTYARTREVLESWKIFISGVDLPASEDWALSSKLLETAPARRTEFAKLAEGEYTVDGMYNNSSGQTWKINRGNFECNGVDIGCPFMYMLVDSSFQHVSPVITRDGAFDQYYSHVLPALFLNQLLPTLSSHSSNLVETHVLCVGNGYGNGVVRWWEQEIPPTAYNAWAQYIVNLCLYSSAFLDVIKHINRVFDTGRRKKTRRLCIWLKVYGHVFMLVLEVTSESVFCFSVNNQVDDRFTYAIVDVFISNINTEKLFGERVAGRLGNDMPVTDKEIPLSYDLKCVSFMARSTMYLSMVNSSIQKKNVVLFAAATGRLIERAAYDEFESSLLEFIKETHSEGKSVWLSPMNSAFVNIADISLMKVERENAGSPEGRQRFVYAGGGKFKERISRSGGEVRPMTDGCVTSAQFLLRECSVILERLRLKTN